MRPDPMICTHKWSSNTGRGGKPDFRPYPSVTGPKPHMHVMCAHCHGRTWVDKETWERLEESGRAGETGVQG